MEVIVIILLIAILIVLITIRKDFSGRLRDLELHITKLEKYIQNNLYKSPAEKEITKEQPIAPVTSTEPPIPEPVKPAVVEQQKEVITVSRPAQPKAFQPKFTVKPTPQPSFFERYPDVEKFIGENLVNKIGIAILVLAIGYFVKYAIDNDWIGPVGRVGVGILCGAILIGFAHRMRNSYKAFSSVLVGGGLAVFYFTITLAFHQFNLFGQTAAFIILVGITVFAVLLSLLYDKQELAIIALIGGFTSPLMVSNGQANYNTLFIYLLILNTGLLVIAYYKSWRILNIVSFVFTVILFLTVLYALDTASYGKAFLYASIFYLLYFVVNIANNVRENKSFIASDFGILLVNTGLYFAAGLYFLTMMHLPQYRGLFSAGLGAINLVLSFILFRNKKVDANILFLLIGITLTFISLTAPIQLHGHNITLFWAAEAVLLYWLLQKSGIALMKLTASLVWLLMLVSLWIDLFQIYTDASLPLQVLANKGFITIICAAISSYLLFVLAGKNTEEQNQERLIIDQSVFVVSAVGLLFLSGFLEINYQFLNHYPGTSLNILYLSWYIPAFIVLLNILSYKILPHLWRLRLALTVCCLVLYFSFSTTFFDLLYQMLKSGHPHLVHFMAHWIAAVFMVVLFYQLIQLCRKHLEENPFAAWLIFGSIVAFLSLEFCLLSDLLFYTSAFKFARLETVYIKTFLPVLWGVLSFLLMWLGMRRKVRVLRIISLTLFTITLIKLFTYDISNIPEAGKIIAFFCLGVLLLIISFMYQKVKKIIVDEENGKG